MNAQWRKEVQLITPAWLLAMALAVLPVWLLWPGKFRYLIEAPGLAIQGAFFVGSIFLAVASFGQELSTGMFPNLLVQPGPKIRLWRMKVIVLAIALALVFAAYYLATYVRVESVMENIVPLAKEQVPGIEWTKTTEQIVQQQAQRVRYEALVWGAFIGLGGVAAAFASGLWTTLLLRQVSAALWLACFVPLLLVGISFPLLGMLSVFAARAGTAVILAAYCALGYVFATRLFLRAEDFQWTGGVISLPALGVRTRSGAGEPRREWKPVRALVRKELQHQQVSLLLGAGLLALHLGVLLVRAAASRFLANHSFLAMTLESVLMLWLALPLVIGGVAIAEERKLDTWATQLTLPVSRRVQFSIKVAVVLLLSGSLGGILPLVLESFGVHGFGLRSGIGPVMLKDYVVSVLLMWLMPVPMAFLACYGSSLSRNTLQALGTAVALVFVAFLLLARASSPVHAGEVVLWAGPLATLIGVPIMALLLLLLLYRNFSHAQVSPHCWRVNLGALTLTLAGVAVVASLLYNRVWEAWVPEEPRHGFAQYQRSEPRVAAKIRGTAFRTGVLLPDGRLWLRAIGFRQPHPGVLWPAARQVGQWRSTFANGADWADIAVNEKGTFALKEDGTLWDLTRVLGAEQRRMESPQRFGETGARWRQLTGAGAHFSGIQMDGTLWEWGLVLIPSTPRFIRTNLPAPVRVGSNSDWTAVADSSRSSVAVRSDGTVWRWRYLNDRGQYVYFPQQWPDMVVPQGRVRSLAVSEEGAVTAIDFSGALQVEGGPRGVSGKDAVWKECYPTWQNQMVGLTGLGELCEWFPARGGPWMFNYGYLPTCPSRYADWVAAWPYRNGYLALAADGSLCEWDSEAVRNNDFVASVSWPHSRLLAPSRIAALRVADLW